jgi:hypothetical protein
MTGFGQSRFSETLDKKSVSSSLLSPKPAECCRDNGFAAYQFGDGDGKVIRGLSLSCNPEIALRFSYKATRSADGNWFLIFHAFKFALRISNIGGR